MLEQFFGFTPEMWILTTLFREEIFKLFSQTDQYGMIFTFVWAFDLKDDWGFVENLCDSFKQNGSDIYFVELEADITERLKRNISENRLVHKPIKRRINQSEADLLNSFEKHRLSSTEGEIIQENYLKINSTNIAAEEVAHMIKKHFQI